MRAVWPQLRVQCGGVRHRVVYAAVTLFDAARDASGEISAKALRATRWPCACATGWPVCSPPFSRARLARNIAHGKERSMEHWLRIVAGLLLLTLQNYWQAAKTSSPCPTANSIRRWPRGASPNAGVGPHGHRAPEIAGQPGQATIVATRVEPDLAERLSKYECPTRGWWKAPGYVMCSPGFCGGGLLRRLVLPVPPLRREAGMGGFLSIGKSRAKVFMEKNPASPLPMSRVSMRPRPSWSNRRLPEEPAGLRPPRRAHPESVLLVGPPGTGKTLLAKAVAARPGYRSFPSQARSSSRCSSRGCGARARPVRAGARAGAGVIFIDELDALGRARGVGGPTADTTSVSRR